MSFFCDLSSLLVADVSNVRVGENVKSRDPESQTALSSSNHVTPPRVRTKARL